MENTQINKVLYLVVCAAPPAIKANEFVREAQSLGWSTCVIATPQARAFIDIKQLEEMTGYSVRIDYKKPGENDSLPKADAIAVVPATFNSINKLANGIADTLAVSLLCEAMGNGTPIVIAPCLKSDLAKHSAFSKSLKILKKSGVNVVYQPRKYHSPEMVPFSEILGVLEYNENPD